MSRDASTSTCVATHTVFAAEAGSAEPWQLQCTQLKSDKSLLSSRLQAAEAAASDAAAELKHAREAAEAASEEIHMLKAEVQELRHQVSLAVAAYGMCPASHVTGLTTAALRFRKGASPAGYQT